MKFGFVLNVARTFDSSSRTDMAKTAATKKTTTPVRRPWLKDDLRVLKGMARKEPLGKIAKTLKRTAAATQHKASVEGISLRLSPKKRTAAKAR